jgi:hypothetical protein
MKDNIIQFPVKERQQQIADQELDIFHEYEDFTDECRDTSQLVYLMIEELLLNESSSFDDIDFRDKNYPESKDMFVIINLISSMLMRYGGISHFLHDYFDVIYEQIMETKE